MKLSIFAACAAFCMGSYAAPTPSNSNPKIALAHFMLNGAYAYDVAQWKKDFDDAAQMGVDGFALNFQQMTPGCNPAWIKDQIKLADQASQASNGTYKLMWSFDLDNYDYGCADWAASDIVALITQYTSSGWVRYNGAIVVSGFAQGFKKYDSDFFQGIKASVTAAKIDMVWAIADCDIGDASQAQSLYTTMPWTDGFMNWNAWPGQGKKADAASLSSLDQALYSTVKQAGKGPYIAAVSPWQYKNDGSQSAWNAYSDYLFPQRLQELTNGNINADIVEVISWNDYGESHYLRNIDTVVSPHEALDHANLQDHTYYELGMNHDAWRIIAKYYLAYWKTGVAPDVNMNQVVYWYRPHPNDAVCPMGASSSQVLGGNLVANAVFAWPLVKDPVTVSITTGSGPPVTKACTQGANDIITAPFPVGGDNIRPVVTISLNGQQLSTSTGSMAYTNKCYWTNFNAEVGLCGPGINGGPSPPSGGYDPALSESLAELYPYG